MDTVPGSEPERSAARFLDSWRNALRATSVRVVCQATFLILFLFLLLLTTAASLQYHPSLQGWLGKFLETDPLVAVATALAHDVVYEGLAWSLVILIPTFFLGRFFCNWICPLGTLNQFTGWLFRLRRPPDLLSENSYRPSQRLKYYILIALLAAAVCGSLQIGLLDPMAMLHRSATTAVMPVVGAPTARWAAESRVSQGALVIGVLFVGVLSLNLAVPRFFCRVLCPLGALLGLVSRFAWWRIERDPARCNGCKRCVLYCEGACEPDKLLRRAECLVCFNCIEECPEGALTFQLFPPPEREVPGADIPGRRAVLAAAAGVVFFPLLRASGASGRNFTSGVIRPPGSLEELAFLERCIKCEQCIRVCPTNVLQPASLEAGFEGLWSPILNFRVGHCQPYCTACGQVCPTGAIRPVSVEERLRSGRSAEQGPIRLGTAHIDVSRCLPHSKNIPCVVCEEVCPTSPKAVYTERQLRPIRNGAFLVQSADANSLSVIRGSEADGVRLEAAGVLESVEGNSNAPALHVCIHHRDGASETHRVAGHDAGRMMIDGSFLCVPEPGDSVELQLALAAPRIDVGACIGCGICENQCPLVGDRRAIYVTAEGETRSAGSPIRDRNRSVRLPAVTR